jgi:aspartyl-tRNA(Asn)/glutamyl-tRNA(Gln) amidotransferase subunit A
MKHLTRRAFCESIAAAATALSCGSSTAGVQEKNAVGSSLDSVAGLTLTDAAAKVRSGQLTSTELTKACLDRIEIYNPKLDAFITVLNDCALRQAAERDAEQQAGRARGPLHGVPIALKDNIDTAGVRTTAGSQVFDDRVPDDDAEVTRRLAAAGAIVIGKANLDEFATGVSYFGSVRNPWALDRDPSGSSSGCAAALAANLAFGAIGTDTGGSIRAPAAYCGVVGLKPTYGLVSMRGIVPLIPTMDHCGPMARTVTDAAMLLNALAGYDRLDVTSVDKPREDYVALLDQPVSKFRLGVPRAPFFDHLDRDTASCVDAAIHELSKLCANVCDTTLPPTADYESTLVAEMYAYHEELFANQEARYMVATRQKLKDIRDGLNEGDRSCSSRLSSYIRRRSSLELLRRRIDESFRELDLVVLPTMRVSPMRLEYVIEYFEHPSTHNPDDFNWDNCEAFNILGIPSISIPCGFTHDGLPVGLTIAGPRFAEGRILALAHAYELSTNWRRRRPPLAPNTQVPDVRR